MNQSFLESRQALEGGGPRVESRQIVEQDQGRKARGFPGQGEQHLAAVRPAEVRAEDDHGRYYGAVTVRSQASLETGPQSEGMR